MPDLKKLAEEELQKYVDALLELHDTRCMTLFEGMVAGFCVIGLLTKDEGNAWLDKVRRVQAATSLADRKIGDP